MSDLRLKIQERQLKKQQINFDVEIILKNLEHALLSESQNEISKIQNEPEKYHELLISAIYTKQVASRPWSCLAYSQQVLSYLFTTVDIRGSVTPASQT